MKIPSLEKLPRFIDAFRPPFEEIEYYARVILQHEGRPPSALPDCRKEAELQLWADRSFGMFPDRRQSRRSSLAG